MRQALSAGWTRIAGRARRTAPAIGDRWAPVFESVWVQRLAALDASCTAAGLLTSRLDRQPEEIRHDD